MALRIYQYAARRPQTISVARSSLRALCCWGARRAGEASLAHHGGVFMDELLSQVKAVPLVNWRGSNHNDLTGRLAQCPLVLSP